MTETKPEVVELTDEEIAEIAAILEKNKISWKVCESNKEFVFSIINIPTQCNRLMETCPWPNIAMGPTHIISANYKGKEFIFARYLHIVLEAAYGTKFEKKYVLCIIDERNNKFLAYNNSNRSLSALNYKMEQLIWSELKKRNKKKEKNKKENKKLKKQLLEDLR